MSLAARSLPAHGPKPVVPGESQDSGLAELSERAEELEDHRFLLEEIQTAHQDLLQENDASLAKFLDKLACHCESETNSALVSSVLRELRAPQRYDCGLTCNKFPKEPELEAALKQAPAQDNGISFNGILADCEPTVSVDDIEPLPQRDLEYDRINSQEERTTERHVRADLDMQLLPFHRQRFQSTDTETTTATEKHVRADLNMQLLPFIATDGSLLSASPPTAFSRLFGSLYRFFGSIGLRRLYCKPQAHDSILSKVVRSNGFKLASAFVIMLNFLFIVVQSDLQMDRLQDDLPPFFDIIGHFFTAFYTVEVLLLMVAEGGDFWVGHDWAWNIFDLVIVFVAYFEIVVEIFGSRGVNTSFLRILRFAKISRVFRMVSAIRMFKEIRIMVDSLVGCLTIFLFCVLTLMVFLSIFAIFFVQGMTSYIISKADLDVDEVAGLKQNFGSVGIAMLTLFKSVTGGDDWSAFYDQIAKLGIMHQVLWLAFMGLYVLAFFNVITAVFCEKAISLATPTIGELIQERIVKEYAYAKEISLLVNKYIVDDGSRLLRADTFEDFINHPEVRIYFETRGMKSFSAQKFFTTLCEIEQSESVSYAQFISACVKLDGVSSALDMHCNAVKQTQYFHHMMRLLKRDHSEVKDLCRTIQEELAKHDQIIEYVKKLPKRSSLAWHAMKPQLRGDESSNARKLAL